MVLNYAKYYSEVKSAKPIFVPIVELSMILHIPYFPVSHTKNTEEVSIRSFKIKKIDETLVGLLNCENKHVISALAGFFCKLRIILITLHFSYCVNSIYTIQKVICTATSRRLFALFSFLAIEMRSKKLLLQLFSQLIFLTSISLQP